MMHVQYVAAFDVAFPAAVGEGHGQPAVAASAPAAAVDGD